MPASWTLAVERNDLSKTEVLETPIPRLEPGEVLLAIDRVGLTANNVTYAILGDSFHYWDFFPTRAGLGLVPLWGFAEVEASTVEGVSVGDRLYGYLPPASHLVVRPGRIDQRGFRDASPHRVALPSPYNAYALTTGDPAYDAQREDLQVLYRPLFFTSFMLADQLEDTEYFGAQSLLFSSASSKTAYGTAFLLQGNGPELIGLTSPGNVEFAESLGCYDRVLPYGEVAALAGGPTAYLDFAGNAELRSALREKLGALLLHEAVVGVTHQQPAGAEALTGSRTTVFFAPDQMRKRIGEWGREKLDERFAEAWRGFAPAVGGWVDVVTTHGCEALRDVWLEVLGGQSPPRVGHVVTLRYPA
jgi:hypothetical protein